MRATRDLTGQVVRVGAWYGADDKTTVTVIGPALGAPDIWVVVDGNGIRALLTGGSIRSAIRAMAN